MKIRSKIAVIAVAFVAVTAGYFAWKHFQKRIRAGQFRNANIVLVTVDTLRADHLPAYGYTRIKTPAIDRLAAESILFEDAVSPIPMTLPSHASILTGLLPPSHGVRDNAGFLLDSRIVTLPEILKQQGYKTAAFVSAFVLDSQFKLDQGFDVYSDDFTLAQARVSGTELYRRAEETEREVDAWLNTNSTGKFFLWVHYYDPHDPYEPPGAYRQEYSGSLYDGEIAYTDEILGKFLARLDQLGLKEKTIVVFAGDHGESLGEHNEQTHALFLYNATQQVPLMFRLPSAAPKRIRATAGLIDIVPTLLDLTGIRAETSLQGKSVLPCINGESQPSRSQYSESLLAELHYGWSPLFSLTTADSRFIDAPRVELYDRRTDPAEQRNIADQHPDLVKTFRIQLQDLLKSMPQNQAAPENVDSETAEKLRSLGYVGTVVKSTSESRTIDPKDKIDVLNAISRASDAMENKNFPLVIGILRPLLEREPQLVDAHYLLANAYLHLGNDDLALRELLSTVELNPDQTRALYNLAFYYQTKGDSAQAESWYLKLLKYEPENLFGNLNLAALYLNSNHAEKAQPYLARVFSMYEETIRTTASPESKSLLLEKVAEIYFRTGDLKKSEECILQALRLTPSRRVLQSHLSEIRKKLPQ